MLIARVKSPDSPRRWIKGKPHRFLDKAKDLVGVIEPDDFTFWFKHDRISRLTEFIPDLLHRRLFPDKLIQSREHLPGPLDLKVSYHGKVEGCTSDDKQHNSEKDKTNFFSIEIT